MTTPAARRVRLAGPCAVVVLLAACGSEADKADAGELPPAAAAFRKYVAAKLGVPETHVDGGPRSEAEASLFAERVGAIWAMTMYHHAEPETAIRGWATPDGAVITVQQNLGLLLAEAGVWGGGVTPALTAAEIADRLVWSLGQNYRVFADLALGAPPPELKLTGGAGTMTFVDDFRTPGPGGAGGGPHQLTRFDIMLTTDHSATATQTALPLPP